MGCFSYTCAVSGLPIGAGDPVRYYLLTENPHSDNIGCYMHDLWFPRVFPLRAEYNDYGSVEEVEEGPTRQAWMDGFQIDLIERGWGDNSCHDLSTSKDMTFSYLLDALREHRVQVVREAPYDDLKGITGVMKMARDLLKEENKPSPEERGTPGLPTRRAAEKILVEAGFALFDGAHQPKAVMVDELAYGQVRIRIGNFGDNTKEMKRVSEALAEHYAVVVCSGSGRYADSEEVLAFPKPGSRVGHGIEFGKRDETPLRVRQAMIREDVWQALLRLKVEDSWNSEKILSVDGFRKGASDAWKMYTRSPKKEKDKRTAMDQFVYRLRDDLPTLQSVFLDSPVPFAVGVDTAFRLVAARHEEMSKEQVESFISTAAEFMFLHVLLAHTRYMWRPSFSAGPQTGEWGLHRAVLKRFLSVAEKKVKEFED